MSFTVRSEVEYLLLIGLVIFIKIVYPVAL